MAGNLILIETQTPSAVANIDFTSIAESTYDVHLLTWVLSNSTYNSVMAIRFFESTVIETAGVYHHVFHSHNEADGWEEQKSASRTHIGINKSIGSATDEIGQGYIWIYNAGNSSEYTTANHQTAAIHTDHSMSQSYGGGILKQASTVDGIRIYDSNAGGNSTGTVSLYGLGES